VPRVTKTVLYGMSKADLIREEKVTDGEQFEFLSIVRVCPSTSSFPDFHHSCHLDARPHYQDP
jgi:hypothetical protein